MATREEYIAFWQTSHWRREYGYRDPKVYSKGYHRAQDIAGGDWGNRPVPALRAGRVVATGFGTAIGHWVALQTERNRVDGYCHLYGGALPRVGTDIPKAGNVSRLAHANERPGSAWSGEHLHFLITDSANGVPNARGWDTDPRPTIRHEFSLFTQPATPTSPGGATAFKTLGDDMPILVRRGTGDIYELTPGNRLQHIANVFGVRMAIFLNTGAWVPDNPTDADLNPHIRDYNDQVFGWMLAAEGFYRFAGNLGALPRSNQNPGGAVVADHLQAILDKPTAASATVDVAALSKSLTDALSGKVGGASKADVDQVVRAALGAAKLVVT